MYLAKAALCFSCLYYHLVNVINLTQITQIIRYARALIVNNFSVINLSLSQGDHIKRPPLNYSKIRSQTLKLTWQFDQ
jgi:hypothetical protein